MKNLIRKILREEYSEGHRECGITYYEDIDDEVFFPYINLLDSIVNYSEETEDFFKTKEKVSLPTNIPLYTKQDYIDLDYVSLIDDNIYEESDIHVVRINDMLWILDGHHRLCRDRMNGNPSNVYLWDENNDKELIDTINCIFYGIGDC